MDTRDNMKPILDACCGSRMFWFDKNNEQAVFMDNRELKDVLCDGRMLEVTPDIVADFRNMPFADESFYLVVFDPPHITHGGDGSWIIKKYGKLDKKTWRDDLKRGFAECFRVLKKNGVLVFKWNEDSIKLHDILKLTDNQPLFGNRGYKTFKTHWIVFMK